MGEGETGGGGKLNTEGNVLKCQFHTDLNRAQLIASPTGRDLGKAGKSDFLLSAAGVCRASLLVSLPMLHPQQLCLC